MTRSELARILFDLVQRKAITPEEMVEMLRRFDAGELGDDLLLPIEESRGDEWLAAAALLFLLLGVPLARTLTKRESARARGLLRKRFESNTATLSATVAAGGGVAQWYNGMALGLSNYTHQMAIAGAGKMPNTATRTTVAQRLAEQWPYLLGLGVMIAARRIGQRPMSAEWVNQRSLMYGGVGWESYWHGTEQDAGYGTIVHYISRDDRRTCFACTNAGRNSPYLVGNHPVPGGICYGGGRCRCLLRFEYDPVAYARLTGRAP